MPIGVDAAEFINFTFGQEKKEFYGWSNTSIENFTYVLNENDPRCSFNLKFSRFSVQQKKETLETGFSVSWSIIEGGESEPDVENTIMEGDMEGDVEDIENIGCSTSNSEAADNIEERPLTRWFNIFHHMLAEMEVKSIWERVISVKVNRLWKEDAVTCVSAINPYTELEFYKGNLWNWQISELLNDFDEGGDMDDNAALAMDDLPDEMWMEGFRMFAFIAYCPSSEVEKWGKFYEDSLAQSPPRRVLQKLVEILNRKVAEKMDTSTEASVYELLAEYTPFKAGAAMVGLSSEKEIQDVLASPVLGTLRDELVSCLESKKCEDLEAATNSLSKKEYEQVESI